MGEKRLIACTNLVRGARPSECTSPRRVLPTLSTLVDFEKALARHGLIQARQGEDPNQLADHPVDCRLHVVDRKLLRLNEPVDLQTSCLPTSAACRSMSARSDASSSGVQATFVRFAIVTRATAVET